MLNIMGAVAEFEREVIEERRKEGIQIAKALHKYKGGKAKLTEAQVKVICDRAAAGENKTRLAREFKVSRQTVYTAISAQ